MEFTPQGHQRYAALVRAGDEVVVGLDFDGVLAPIVDDPEHAHIHPEAHAALAGLGGQVRAIAVITGRPARQAVALGGLDELADALATQGCQLLVFGQYGNERWSGSDRRVVGPRPPSGLAGFEADLPRVLREADAADAWVEDKGLAVAVHTRRLPEPEAAFERLLPRLTELAQRHGLAVEPGRAVVEIRAPGSDKGGAVRTLVADLDAGGFLYAGDDLGDLPAFAALGELAEDGLPTLRVASGSEEENALVEQADVVVDGPDGVLELLRGFTGDLAGRRV